MGRPAPSEPAAGRPECVRIAGCRSCGAPGPRTFLDLGCMPPAGRMLRPEDLALPEPHYPLETAFCERCSLVQILDTVDPELLFGGDYHYYSSFSDELLRHSRANVLELVERRGLGARSLAVELASNDGYLLRYFVERGVPVLGIDPAAGQVAAARAAGVDSLQAFFDLGVARAVRAERGPADVVLANNVLAHVADTNGFVAGIAALLKDEGVAVIEVPYVRDLIDGREFDTIYHEHLCYFSAGALDALFRRHGLFLNDVRRLAIHGGSLRLYVEPREAVGPAVAALLEEEHALGLDRFEHYAGFGEEVRGLKRSLRSLLEARRAVGDVAAYGAAAKGSTLLNYFELGPETLDFVVDRNVHKHGKLMPGVRVPISAPARLLEEQPATCLLLTWNFRDEILAQQAEYRARGGRFVVPIPTPELV